MNISSEISSIHESNSSFNEVKIDYGLLSVVYIISILVSFPINSYVIWLIVTGTGNGLAAEFFILNLCVFEIFLCVETIVVYLLYDCDIPWIVVAFLDGIIIGHPLFECLICVERYLAVVHPVTFLKYKPLRYRLICSAVAWGTTFVFGGFNIMILSFVFLVYFIFLIVPFLIFFSIQLFCCVAVLRALKQSGPGERGREREEENHMKRKAFNLILITTVSTIIIYTPYILMAVITLQSDVIFICVGQICLIFAGLVQPVLFLYRVGKLNFIKCQYILFSSKSL